MDNLSSRGPVRRSVTIRPRLNLRIRDFMAACTRYGIDVDYTSALNMFAELGARWIEESDKESRQASKDIFSSYLGLSKLEDSEALAYFREFEEFRKWKHTKTEYSTAKLSPEA